MEVPSVPENINEITYYDRDESPVAFVSVGDCRTFMKRIADEEWVWPELQKNGWGGHWHKAVLNIALLEEADESYVDFMPYILRVIYDDVDDQISQESRARIAFTRIVEAREQSDSIIEVSDIIGVQGYASQGDLPGSILRSFRGLRREYLEDQYFYGRHGLTGERLTPVRFAEQPTFEDE